MGIRSCVVHHDSAKRIARKTDNNTRRRQIVEIRRLPVFSLHRGRAKEIYEMVGLLLLTSAGGTFD